MAEYDTGHTAETAPDARSRFRRLLDKTAAANKNAFERYQERAAIVRKGISTYDAADAFPDLVDDIAETQKTFIHSTYQHAVAGLPEMTYDLAMKIFDARDEAEAKIKAESSEQTTSDSIYTQEIKALHQEPLDPTETDELLEMYTATRTPEQETDARQSEIVTELRAARANLHESLIALRATGLSEEQMELLNETLRNQQIMAERASDLLWFNGAFNTRVVSSTTLNAAVDHKSDERSQYNEWYFRKPEGTGE